MNSFKSASADVCQSVTDLVVLHLICRLSPSLRSRRAPFTAFSMRLVVPAPAERWGPPPLRLRRGLTGQTHYLKGSISLSMSEPAQRVCESVTLCVCLFVSSGPPNPCSFPVQRENKNTQRKTCTSLALAHITALFCTSG